jgi:hypothetical protein
MFHDLGRKLPTGAELGWNGMMFKKNLVTSAVTALLGIRAPYSLRASWAWGVIRFRCKQLGKAAQRLRPLHIHWPSQAPVTGYGCQAESIFPHLLHRGPALVMFINYSRMSLIPMMAIGRESSR